MHPLEPPLDQELPPLKDLPVLVNRTTHTTLKDLPVLVDRTTHTKIGSFIKATKGKDLVFSRSGRSYCRWSRRRTRSGRLWRICLCWLLGLHIQKLEVLLRQPKRKTWYLISKLQQHRKAEEPPLQLRAPPLTKEPSDGLIGPKFNLLHLGK